MARAKSPVGEAEETHKKFTVQYVRGLKPRGNNYFEEMDRDAPLSIRVLADGSKNWVWRGRIDGRQTKRVIGSFNDIEDEDYLTLADARDKARDETRDAKRSGLKRPPHLRVVHARTAAPKPRDSERTFNEAFAEYRASHVDKLASGPDIVQAFEKRMLPLFGERKLRSLTRAELDAHFDTLVAAYQGARKSRKPTNGAGVNNLLANVKAMLTWCVGKDYLEGNPAAAIKKKVKPRARESFLSGRQLGWVQQAFEGTRQYRTSLLLLLHTGCRRSDIFGLKWSEVILIDEDENPDAETPFSGTKLVIKETKNDDIHTV